jgi:hypothetical protein
VRPFDHPVIFLFSWLLYLSPKHRDTNTLAFRLPFEQCPLTLRGNTALPRMLGVLMGKEA